MEWKTIETAPKDGTIIDVWSDGERYADAWFLTKENLPNINWHEGWVIKDSQGGRYPEYVYGEVTHWMPLPQSPSGV